MYQAVFFQLRLYKNDDTFQRSNLIFRQKYIECKKIAWYAYLKCHVNFQYKKQVIILKENPDDYGKDCRLFKNWISCIAIEDCGKLSLIVIITIIWYYSKLNNFKNNIHLYNLYIILFIYFIKMSFNSLSSVYPIIIITKIEYNVTRLYSVPKRWCQTFNNDFTH